MVPQLPRPQLLARVNPPIGPAVLIMLLVSGCGHADRDSSVASLQSPIAARSGCYVLSGAVGFPPQTADVYLPERIELQQRRSSVDNHLFGYAARMIDPPVNWTRIEGVGRAVLPDSLILDLGVATYHLRVADSTRLLGTVGFGTGEYATSFGQVEARLLDECPD